MSFQTPITVREVIDNIRANEYVLPAIQREFVWKEEQIVKLFDSLMKGYPIGSFLFWEVKEENKNEYKFYKFLNNYHQRDNRHNEKINLIGDQGDITAVLDGQQRFTSLYIGLTGTYAKKKRYYRWDNDNAFPVKHLYLDLLSESTDYEMKYHFKFLTPDKAKKENQKVAKHWFKVEDILGMKEEYEVNDYIFESISGLSELDKAHRKYANKTLFRLHSLIHKDKIINYFLETEQDIEKVLDIFIRVNSGGTKLSYSDLLLSIATAQWEEKDARDEIHSFVDEINNIGSGFRLDKNFVLKASLVLTDIEDIRFKVKNFNRDNMIKIENNWNQICRAIRETVKLISGFGFQDKSLTSYNAIIPISYYLLNRDFPNNFILSNKYREDRKMIKKWLNIVLLKRTFSNGPDNVLRNVREAIRESELTKFPIEDIVKKLNEINRTVRFEEEELDSLLDNKYNGRYTFSILSFLYPTLDYNNKFHQDHIYPRSLFKKSNLKDYDYDEEKYEAYREKYNILGNLQLLEGVVNQEKSDKPLKDWLEDNFDTDEERDRYKKRHYIPDVDLSFDNFLEFFERREELIKSKLRKKFNQFINLN